MRRSPVLCILSSWSLLMSGDLDAAEARLDDAEAALAAGVRDPDLAATWADTEDLRTAPATVAVYRAALAQPRRCRRHRAPCRDVLDLADQRTTSARCRRRVSRPGRVGSRRRGRGAVHVLRCGRSLQAAGNFVDAMDTTIPLADMWVAAGRPGRARRLYEQALQTATADGPPYPRATADLHVGLAELDRELDDLTSAEEHLELARVLVERASITESRYRWYVVMAQVRAADGDYDARNELARPGRGAVPARLLPRGRSSPR